MVFIGKFLGKTRRFSEIFILIKNENYGLTENNREIYNVKRE